ncbi:hypothetical protein JCM10450v2_002566 [Rhodotorula kratochvilovae]
MEIHIKRILTQRQELWTKLEAELPLQALYESVREEYAELRKEADEREAALFKALQHFEAVSLRLVEATQDLLQGRVPPDDMEHLTEDLFAAKRSAVNAKLEFRCASESRKIVETVFSRAQARYFEQRPSPAVSPGAEERPGRRPKRPPAPHGRVGGWLV